MSYIANISDETYNQLLSSLSNENRDLFISSFKKNESITTNTNNINIRILSENEYNKFLLNSNFGGSITAGANNVFNFYNNNITISCVAALGAHAANVSNNTYDTRQLLITRNSINSNGTINWHAAQYGGSYTDSTSCYFEIIINNKNNTYQSINKTYPNYECLYGNYSGSEYLLDTQNKKAIPIKFSNSNFQNISKTSSVHTFAHTASYNSHKMTLNINVIPCFRPIFQYIDNNKSSNIYR